MKMTIEFETRVIALLTVGKVLNNETMINQIKPEEITQMWRDTYKIRTVLEKHEARCDNPEMFDNYYQYIRQVQYLNDYLYKNKI